MALIRTTQIRSRIAIAVAAVVAVFGAVHLYGAVTYQKLYSFQAGAEGHGPGVRLVEGADGFFYGLTQLSGSGACGTAFKISSDGATFVPLHDFTFEEGCVPTGLLLASSGLFYGTAAVGPSGTGTAFSMTADGTVAALHEFSSPGGTLPLYPVIEGADGLFYGTTLAGGDFDAGTAYRMDAGGNVTILHHFGGDPTAGVFPSSGLLLATDGSFYGTTLMGGNPGAGDPGGTVYRMTVTGDVGTVQYLFNFAVSGADGHAPFGGLVQTGPTTFYGTTTSDVTYFFSESAVNKGTVFKLEGTVLTTLHAFSLNPADLDGATPYGQLLFANGDLFGTTLGGGTSSGVGGTVFRYPLATPGPLEILHVFDGLAVGDAGIYPVAGLIQGTDGKLYGTTGGLPFLVHNDIAGTIFSLDVGLSDPGVTLSAFTLSPPNVKGGATSTATVTLTGAAPAGGLLVTITSDKPFAAASTSVLVAEGTMTASTPITTFAVTSNTNVKMTAEGGGVSITAPLNVKKK